MSEYYCKRESIRLRRAKSVFDIKNLHENVYNIVIDLIPTQRYPVTAVCSTVELNLYVHSQDLFLLNQQILIPTCFPVEMAGAILGQMT
jgi:hypothetical protein